MAGTAYGDAVTWQPARPRFHPLRLVLSWLLSAASLLKLTTSAKPKE